MPQPDLRDVHVDQPLQTVSIAYTQDQSSFIAGRVFAPINVSKESDLYYQYPKGAWLRSQAQLKAPGDESAGTGYENDTARYEIEVYGLHKRLADRIRNNADAPLDMDRDATEFLTQQLLMKRDQVWGTEFFTTGKWSVDTTPAALWDTGPSTPIKDIRDQMIAMQKGTGKKANKLVLGAEVWATLQDNADFLDRIQFGTPGNPSIVAPQLLASVLELDEVLIAESITNTAVEGAADAIDFVHGKNALLVHAAPRPGLMTASAGYTFQLNDTDGFGSGMRIFRVREERRRSWVIEAEMGFDMKLVDASLGVFFDSVIS